MKMSKILLVDDDIELTDLLAEVLRLTGFEVEVANNGQEALDKLNASHQLVLLDIMMPVLNGIETLKKIRQTSNVPVMMLTARGEEIDRVLGLELGADDYITKPFSPRELVARVRAHLSRYERLVSAKQGDVLVIRGLKIDRSAHRVFVNGEERTLTAKEFDLLNFLASNPNRVFKRDELFREIWGEESIGEIATITVHIKKIREKIEVDSAKPQYIETIWGVGYRFRV